MTLGQWLGKWSGEWQGATVEQNPGAMYGSAAFSVSAVAALSATGSGQATGAASFSISATAELSAHYDGVREIHAEQAPTHQGGGGGGGDAGTSYILKDHGWVKLTKVVRTGAWAYAAGTQQACAVDTPVVCTGARAYGAAVTTAAEVSVRTRSRAATYTRRMTGSGAASVVCATVHARTVSHPGHTEWIAADELMMLIEEMG